jgi:branched-chain amino acid transport system substrate-binding protein
MEITVATSLTSAPKTPLHYTYMDKINIGLLLPSSTILPIGKDFEKGLKEGLKQSGEAIEVEIVKEFIGQGDIKLTEKACNKFFSFDDVDVVTGVVSIRAANEAAERFKARKCPLLINDLGGHIPNVNLLNEYVFINTPHLWQHAWTMGHWGVKTFGKKGMFIASVYDAGYSFSQMFYDGMKAADPESEWSFSVPPMPPAGELSNMDVIFPFLEQYQPDFIFAAFCGGETTLFLNEMIKRGWHRKTKITALPYLLEPFKPLDDDVTIYTIPTFNNHPEVTAAGAFHYLGTQCAKAILAAANAPDGAGLQAGLAKQSYLFNVANAASTDNKLTIMQNDITAGQVAISSKIVAEWDTFPLDAEKIKPLTGYADSGWNNPYLCI